MKLQGFRNIDCEMRYVEFPANYLRLLLLTEILVF